MRLSKLVEKLNSLYDRRIKIKIDPKIINVCYDSRKVTHGSIFVAIKGIELDGHDFIYEAINNGAVVIITQNNCKITYDNIEYIRVNNTRKCLAEIACIINYNPSEAIPMIGITGTNGKTTTSYIINQILIKVGYFPGLIGTISKNKYKKTGYSYPSTTPESLELQCTIRSMLKSKTHIVMEVSSHALDLYRVHGCYFDITVFTNLTHDHLDYHNNLENYWNVKQKLFTDHLKKSGVAIINIDDYRGNILAKNLCKKRRVITTGYKKKCDIWATSVKYTSEGTQGKIITPIGSFNLNSSLMGNFNLSNTLNAIGVCIALGIKLIDISVGINTKINIPGRLDSIHNSKGIFVYVDYAHTPDALEKVINMLKFFNRGKVITIFGCGGNKDISKRIIMGKISGRLSNISIITSDNPRSENIETINNQIIKGIKKTKSQYVNPLKLIEIKLFNKKNYYTIISDRQEAIFTGIKIANPGDTVIIAGKGHEKYQILENKILKFDDKKIAKKQLDAL